jgi:hypothetical protein
MTARLYQRSYSLARRVCCTEGCSREATNLAGRCYTCSNNLKRFAHPQQEPPLDSTLEPYILRAKTQRARHKRLDMESLEARYRAVVDQCRGNASPTYRESGKLSFNVNDREACALIRDISEGERMADYAFCLDLMTGLMLLRLDRPHAFRSDDAFLAVVVETFRKKANIGLKFAPLRPGASRQQSYRKWLRLPVRLAAGRYLMLALGGAADALAKREHKQAEQDRETRESYWATVRALEQATT